jgi:hypothetical protein
MGESAMPLPNLARVNAWLDAFDAGPPEPVWTPPRQPLTLVAPLLDADGVWHRHDALGLVEVADDQPDAVPLLVEHRAEGGVHGVVVDLHRAAGVLWAVLLCDDHAAHLVRSGQLTQLSPTFIGEGHNSLGSDGRRHSHLRDGRLVEVSLVEASASHAGPAGVTPSDVRYQHGGLPLDWPARYRSAYQAAWEKLAPREDVARYRSATSTPAGRQTAAQRTPVPDVATRPGVTHTRYFADAGWKFR